MPILARKSNSPACYFCKAVQPPIPFVSPAIQWNAQAPPATYNACSAVTAAAPKCTDESGWETTERRQVARAGGAAGRVRVGGAGRRVPGRLGLVGAGWTRGLVTEPAHLGPDCVEELEHGRGGGW